MLDAVQTQKAANALLTHIKKKNENSNDLLEDDNQIVWLIIATKKFSDASKTKPVRIPLKHSITKPDTEVCLFVKDPQREYKDLLQEKKVKSVSKVLGVTKLRNRYKPYEAKRQLCASYGLFLADARVIPVLPKLLGKTFFLKKKQPIPVDLTKSDLKKEIERAISSTYMHINQGTCSAIKIGLTSQTPGEVTENITTAISHIVEKIPRKWKNIQSIHIKTSDSVSLPIFNSLPGDGLRISVDRRASGKKNSKSEEAASEEEDEEEDDE
ncbi:hypothetical protein BGW38_009750 [Lunasporangiospora selenospora]|uniref:Ribosomal L1 domain-containing protein 1 n=1 Tax=Lunasporangiospora selenospora TaxID=979761 RepID=A0A9P6FXQ8_9FUNG|nr:hypothetical protein BGW38_009750 [Lunasporangiospora selenospora]